MPCIRCPTKAVQPVSSLDRKSAPRFSSSTTASKCPRRAACDKAVAPNWSRDSILTSRSTKRWRMSCFPCPAATCNDVRPFRSLDSALAPCSRSSIAALVCPFAAACRSADLPSLSLDSRTVPAATRSLSIPKLRLPPIAAHDSGVTPDWSFSSGLVPIFSNSSTISTLPCSTPKTVASGLSYPLGLPTCFAKAATSSLPRDHVLQLSTGTDGVHDPVTDSVAHIFVARPALPLRGSMCHPGPERRNSLPSSSRSSLPFSIEVLAKSRYLSHLPEWISVIGSLLFTVTTGTVRWIPLLFVKMSGTFEDLDRPTAPECLNAPGWGASSPGSLGRADHEGRARALVGIASCRRPRPFDQNKPSNHSGAASAARQSRDNFTQSTSPRRCIGYLRDGGFAGDILVGTVVALAMASSGERRLCRSVGTREGGLHR